MSDKLPFVVSLLTQDALIEGIINKDDSDLFFYYVRNITLTQGPQRVVINSARLTSLGLNSYPTASFSKWRLSSNSLMLDTFAVLPGDDAALAAMKKVWKEPKNPASIVIYAGHFAIKGQALSNDLSDTIDTFAYFPMMNANVSCLLPQNHFTEMNVPYLVVNGFLAQIGIQ